MQTSWIRDDENLRSVILILSDMCLSLFFSIPLYLNVWSSQY